MKLPIVEGVRFVLLANWPGYCVGDDGSVWSRRSRHGRQRGELEKEWRLRRPTVARYKHVSLYKRDGSAHTVGVHRLVLEAFVGPCPEGAEACHSNGDCLDNHLLNLRWDTPFGNATDRQIHQTQARGSRQGLAKLTEADIPEIRRRLATGESKASIARSFKVDRNVVFLIATGKTWRHV